MSSEQHIINDAGPLITLAQADRLDDLKLLGSKIHITDVVIAEVGQHHDKKGAAIFSSWLAQNPDINHATTPIGRATFAAEAADPMFRRERDLGEMASVWLANELVARNPTDKVRIVYEDGAFASPNLRATAHPTVKFSTTGDILNALEVAGKIRSAAEVFDRVQAHNAQFAVEDRRDVARLRILEDPGSRPALLPAKPTPEITPEVIAKAEARYFEPGGTLQKRVAAITDLSQRMLTKPGVIDPYIKSIADNPATARKAGEEGDAFVRGTLAASALIVGSTNWLGNHDEKRALALSQIDDLAVALGRFGAARADLRKQMLDDLTAETKRNTVVVQSPSKALQSALDLPGPEERAQAIADNKVLRDELKTIAAQMNNRITREDRQRLDGSGKDPRLVPELAKSLGVSETQVQTVAVTCSKINAAVTQVQGIDRSLRQSIAPNVLKP